MKAIPRAESGLAWSDPQKPLVGYGFQDAIIKSGEVLYSSALFYEASMLMVELAKRDGSFPGRRCFI